MAVLLFITHPEVTADPARAIPDWSLSETGRRRAASFAGSKAFSKVSSLWTSAETKAQETVEILASARNLSVTTDPRLGENDRSATGYLPPEEFERAADAFFATPDQSIRGWERAVDAQMRIETAVRDIARQHIGGDLAIVSHGAVGSLLYCRLFGLAVDRKHDQPFQGHWWSADLPSLCLHHGWRSIG